MQQGTYQTLTVLTKAGKGWVLVNNDQEQAFLPEAEVLYDISKGDELDVFVYLNTKGDFVASMQEAKIELNQYGILQVKSNSNFGSFMDWGVGKDLLAPFREQQRPMKEGGWYLVYCFQDEKSSRITVSSKLNNYLLPHQDELKEGEKVDLLIWEDTDLGTNVIVENKYKGLIFKNEIFADLHPGDQIAGFVKKVREDGKLDISLQAIGKKGLDENAEKLFFKLQNEGGFIPLTDKSDPEEIYELLSMSKKAFKRSVGILYKERKITIEEDGIHVNQES